MTIFGSSILAVLAALFFIWLFRRLALRVGFVDRPGGRKLHEQEVPLIGGIAIFFGFCFSLLSLPISLHEYRGLIAGGSLLLTIGIVDDFRELNSKIRLLGEIAAALILILWGHVQVTHLGNLCFFGDISLGIAGIPFTVLLVVGFLNAMNMTDGQDGLAGGIALGEIILLSYLCWHAQRQMDLAVLTILGLLLIVFLAFNMRMPWRKHAAIFLGDAGSTFIAFVVAWFAISVGQSHSSVKPAIILWILAFPVFDLIQVCLARLKQGKSLLEPSLDHFHHLLQTTGIDQATSTWILTMFSFALGVTGVLLNHFQISEGWQFLAWLMTFLVYLRVAKSLRKSTIYHYARNQLS